MNIESDDDVSSFNIFYSPLQAIQSMDSDCEAAYRTTSDKKEYKSRRLLSTDSAGCSSSQRPYKSKRIIHNIPGVTAAPQITCNCVLPDGSPVCSATQHFAHDSPYAQIGDHNTEDYAHGDSTSTATCIDHYKSRRLVFLEPDPCSHVRLTNKSSSSADYKGKTKCLVSTEDVDFSPHRTVCSSYKRKTKCFVSTEEQNVPHVPLKLQAPTFCSKCGAKKFAFESLMFCCGGGEIKIADNEYPPLLIDLFTSRSELAVHFRKYSRLYNNMFAFSSLGGSIHASTKKGIYVFKLHGQLYHFVPDLIPTDNKPKFVQLYFYDAQHEIENRFGLFPELRAEIVSMLMEILANNPYAKFFKSLQHINIEENTSIVINKTTALDQRVYNAPSADEVAAILIDGFSSDETRTPYIVVWGKSNTSHRIYHYYGCYDPLQYPILFPKGERGWHQELRKMCSGRISYREHSIYPVPPEFAHSADDLLMDEAVVAQDGSKKRKFRVSCREYYAYRLQIRPANYLLRTSRLFQQFIVDEYVKIENTRLDYMRNNQAQLHAELYQGIMDTMNSGEFNCRNVGHRIILPPFFIGGPRDMKKRYLNAMALVQKYGKPDIFLTITCNPNWLEIKEELAEGEIPQHRPDLVSRIFRAKLVVLKKHLKDKKIFGEIAAMIHVIEFQKRGLPHAHFLIILQPSCKVRQPEQFDQFVSAELTSCL